MAVAQFAREYTTVRRAEGWGSSDRAYYQALPFVDLTGRFERIWRIRAKSYATFITKVLQPLDRAVSDEDCLVPPARLVSKTSNKSVSSTVDKEPLSGGRQKAAARL